TTPLHTNLNIIEYPWDFVKYFPEKLNNDLYSLIRNSKKREILKKKQANNPKDVFISHGCNIYPNVFFNAAKGPVYISKGVTIEPSVYIEGPVFIGKDSTIK